MQFFGDVILSGDYTFLDKCPNSDGKWLLIIFVFLNYPKLGLTDLWLLLLLLSINYEKYTSGDYFWGFN